ncbi:MAG: SIMPL domain-containing protein [Sphingomonas sp.]
MKMLLFLAGVAVPMASAAQDTPGAHVITPTIRVLGTGEVQTPPDVATMRFSVRGERQTPDDATRALVAKQKTIVAGLGDLAHGQVEVQTGNVEMNVARAGDCQLNRYGSGASLSQGPCAIIGYVATLSTTVRLKDIKLVGTAAALAAQRGAEDAAVSGFDLVADTDARRRATAAALADAKQQAEAIASGSGEHLGRLLSVQDEQASGSPPPDIRVTALVAVPAPPPPPPPPPGVTLTPAPIDTSARLIVTYAIGD